MVPWMCDIQSLKVALCRNVDESNVKRSSGCTLPHWHAVAPALHTHTHTYAHMHAPVVCQGLAVLEALAGADKQLAAGGTLWPHGCNGGLQLLHAAACALRQRHPDLAALPNYKRLYLKCVATAAAAAAVLCHGAEKGMREMKEKEKKRIKNAQKNRKTRKEKSRTSTRWTVTKKKGNLLYSKIYHAFL